MGLDSYEHDNAFSGFVKDRRVLDQLGKCQFLKKDLELVSALQVPDRLQKLVC